MLAPVCVFIYLTNEASKSEGRIHGIFITRNFLKDYLGQRIIFDGGYEFKFMYITFTVHNKDNQPNKKPYAPKSLVEGFS